MRCERCGVVIEAGSMCDACAEGAPPIRRSRLGHPVTLMTGLIFVAGLAILIVSANFHACGCGHAPQTKSLNNIKQLALAVMQYSQDYNETYPGWVRNPDGAYVHNVWDQQIDIQVKSKDSYNNDNGGTGIRSYADPAKSRVLTYGLNGLLIAPADAYFNANFDRSNDTDVRPEPLSPSMVANPSGTILFAELATKAHMPGVYGLRPLPLATSFSASSTGSSQWQKALDGWIDISPRDFVEVVRPVENNYNGSAKGYEGNGVGRDMYGGGASYAFCDGHAKFLKLGQSVGIGAEVGGKTVTADNCWEAWNTRNMWMPQ